MSNEFQHKSVGSQMTQTEYEHTDGTGHIFDSQAAGDILFASSSTVLSKLAIGTAGKVLAVNSGASAPEYVAALTGVTSVLNTSLVVGRDADNDIDFATDNNIIFRAAGADQIKLVDGVLQPVTDSDVDLGTTGVRFKDAFIDSITTTGNVTVGGDLTITGDDLFMGTNTAGHLLIADGTNFNPTAVGDLSEISTVANDDVFIAVDTSGGGLKKIARSAIVAGLATSGAISNVVEDTSPQLGGNLDTNSNNIIIDDAHFISDENNNEQIIFQTTSSAVNQFDVTNAATGNAPQLSATGGDTNIDLALLAKGSGHVTIVGNTASGAIQFNCENNSHGQIVKAQPHSAGVTNVLLLPAGGDSTLVSLESTDTLTNKTLTSPKINEDVAITATATELNLMDGGTSAGTTAVADGDGIVTNDGGTMRQTTVQTFATYFGSEITNMSNLVETGALNAGSITSGFGTIDTGSSSISTTGAVRTGDINLGHASDTTIARASAGEVTIEGVAVKKVGTENMWVPAQAMTPRDNAGCGALTTTAAATNGRADITHLPFDASTQEHAQFSVAMPKSWNEGTIKAQFYWTTTGSDTDAVIWGISGVSYANDNPMDVAFGTAVTVTDNILSAAKDILVTAETADVTIAGSPAAGEICYFEVFRDADDGSDTVGEDCLLIGVKIIYTTDTSTDA